MIKASPAQPDVLSNQLLERDIQMAIAALDGRQEFIAALSRQLLTVFHHHFQERLQQQIAETDRYRRQLEQENNYLQEEMKARQQQTELTNSSAAMASVHRLINQVAATGTSVLLTGETGTGKELVAHAIHNKSLRKDKLLVKINCAALPPNLIESELFGHERGSFTGAIERRIGKFELAHGGTLLLDEIGEIPITLQAKLLRALQEKEIERIGGKGPIKIDVRIIAATNRNLLQEVQTGKFRPDLYFRLNVFPLHLPPLRQRLDEVPELARFFVHRYAAKNNRHPLQISDHAIKELLSYDWPGNIRELEHVIERSIILCTGPVLKEIIFADKIATATPETIKTLDENEREHIMEVLKKTRGKIAGAGGAARLLDIPPTTLHSKMKKLGIAKAHL
ncbi:sigma-54-dependent Fis family transcriptional regulator [Chitinophaga sp. sic0106]|uniref:sigma-54 interaction domain-containing protein n=1 Tax=Chitinophaga sp. sic0106 TaxID=2854785 RepID=UPI001C47DE30|nr:sigma-54 dependent transcriptional regulator [Chitinophaga sp. sic0106]MBV7532131.1 sigma-54 dependent transcriptional regulator [Chitinophaga sp. sic0106]